MWRPADAIQNSQRIAAAAETLGISDAVKLPASVKSTQSEPSPATAEQTYQQAMAIANQAVEAYQSAQGAKDAASRLTFTRRERSLWQKTIQKLADIPKTSALQAQAAEKQTHYRQLLATAEGKLAVAEGAFLVDIIRTANVDPQRVHVTFCRIDATAVTPMINQAQVDGERCRQHQGDVPMASAASLIKLPIAVALMRQVAANNIDLDSEIFINFGNFTENAEGASIDVGESYPLREVMGRMIDESNNIATNQLIDYLGRDTIARTIAEMGYTQTAAGHKLVGDRIVPEDAGSQINRSTTNDITAMMANVYSLEAPGDNELQAALASQRDRELGYQALADMGPKVQWLGEKTGQNNRMLGTTLAMEVDGKRYALTVAIDYGGDPYVVQRIVRGVAAHIVETGL